MILMVRILGLIEVIGVLWSVIKWVGIVIGIALAVVLLLAACILFVPLRYRLAGSAGETNIFQAKVSWLFHIVHVSVVFSEAGERHQVYLFGIPLFRTKKKQKKEFTPQDNTPHEERRKECHEEHHEHHEEHDKKHSEPKSKGKQPTQSEKQKRAFSLSFGKRLGTIRNKGGRLLQMIRDDNTSQLIALIMENAGFLLHHIKPSRIKGWVHFGTSDPCTTGQILGVLGVVFAAWGKGIAVKPDFEEEILEGEAEIRGRLRLVIVLIIVLRILPSAKWKRWKRQWDAIHV
jgi:hypothetical protein